MRLLAASIVTIVVCLSATTSAQNTAAGTFTVKGASVKFTHAYAFWLAPWNDKTKPNLHVLLTDAPIPENTIPSNDGGLSKMAALTREMKIHALELRFVGGDTTRLFGGGEQGAVYHSDIQPARFGVSGPLQFTQVSNDGKVLKGKVTFDPELANLFGNTVDASFEVALPSK